MPFACRNNCLQKTRFSCESSKLNCLVVLLHRCVASTPFEKKTDELNVHQALSHIMIGSYAFCAFHFIGVIIF
ncbi:hypothetical protein M514_00262 [Trichuris suis]|uniref:Uncharacterized protein n=1 Tax=Trichuris suis TaxID=68888 RepID=A0A085MPF3_9BILA|nr:hypothetical protein M513_00262 [Trichuris suis]KFD67862.1 hypothetical protein M514_00262 [Trichuris suis]